MSVNPRPTVKTSSDYPEAPTTSGSESECAGTPGRACGADFRSWSLTGRPGSESVNYESGLSLGVSLLA